MDGMIWAIVAALAVVLLAVVFLTRKKKKRREPDYKAFFMMGVIWLLAGLVISDLTSGLWILGLVFFIIGLANKEKWGKKRRPLTKMERKIQKIIIIVLALLVILGLVLFLLVEYYPTACCR